MITYTDSCASISTDALQGFFVGWPRSPSPETHLKVLKQSAEIELALDGETGKVVGFANAISDGVLSAYIPLLEVLPAYQSRGIGKELMRRLLERLNGLYMVDLTCDANLHPFYRKLGLQESTGMMLRNFDSPVF